MTGSSVDEDKMAAERLLAEQLMDLPDTALLGAGLVVQSCKAQVLKTSKSRPILRYIVTCLDREKAAPVRRLIIGKGCYRHDGSKVFDSMRRLWSEGFAEDRHLTIPEPIAYLPELKLLLQGRAPGKALYEYIDHPAEALMPVSLTARWLAKLHKTTVTGVPVLPMEYEEMKLHTYRDVLMRICPQFAARVEGVAERILSSLEALDPRQVVPTHGDFQPKNVSILRNRVTVIDFDRFALAHPARDVGHFIGQSMSMSYARTGSFEEIEPWNTAFLKEYAGPTSPEARSAVPIYVARTFMEVLKHKILLDPAKNAHLLPAWLDECERWLDRARVSPTATRARLSKRKSEIEEGEQMPQTMSSKEIKQELGRRIEVVNRPEFLDSRIRPHFSDAEVNGSSWKTRVLQLDGTGAATLELSIDGHKVFAKFYHPDDENAPLIYEKLKALRAAGFGPGERYQVVEPLDFVPEYGMLLTRGADGPAVSDSIEGDWDALLSGAVESARWLGKLHSSPVRIGPPRSLAASSELLSVARRLAKVITRSPGHLGTADGMIREMEKMAEETVDGILVQGHGQYRPIHVFIGGSSVTVIDMDRSRPYDPAYDVVEFLVRMRKSVLKYAGSVEPANAPTDAFLETYISAVKDRSYLSNLSFHWARFILHGLNGEMKDDESGDPEFDRTIAFYHSEFENVLEGRFGV